MNGGIIFQPILPVWAICTLALAGLILIAFSYWRGAKAGAPWRVLALGILTAALFQPIWRAEDRAPLNDILTVFVDDSESQNLGDRAQRTETALEKLEQQLSSFDNLDLDVVRLKGIPTDLLGSDGLAGASFEDTSAGTRLVEPIRQHLADIPQDRLAGIVLLTDGQISDVPSNPQARDFGAPVHSLLTGLPGEKDRRLEVIEAPRYGIVDETVPFSFKVIDQGDETVQTDGAQRMAMVRVTLDGEEYGSWSVPIGEQVDVELEIGHAGANVIEIAADELPGELTTRNNRAVIETNGIRDRLRVLLISGEPHPGERVWRNLLKADPSVDLVHFTILRPPEKHDDTPIDELALIAFPTRELFVDKLDSFDLVIFDRYRRRGVLPVSYFANIARYVENGGALLAATGPEYASPFSLYRTPLASVLPARPNGEVADKAYRPVPTDAGNRHPITAGLAPENGTAPDWGRIFRLIGADIDHGEVLMESPEGAPLVVIDKVDKGRVAEIMTDQLWLWSRGYDGGGPQAELLRRLAHWLMKEPDLEEEHLSAHAQGNELTIQRRTMADSVPPVRVTDPQGSIREAKLLQTTPGLFTVSLETVEPGLYEIANGDLQIVAAVGRLNPQELQNVLGTPEKLAPLIKATGGGLFELGQNLEIPRVRQVGAGERAAGTDWMGIVRNETYAVTDISQIPVLKGALALALILGALALAWYRESR